MFKKYSRYIILLFFIWHSIILRISYIVSYFIRYGSIERFYLKDSLTVFFITNLIWYIIVVYSNAYEFIRVEHIERIITKTIQLVLFLLASTLTIIVVLHFNEISRLRILYFAMLFLFSIVF